METRKRRKAREIAPEERARLERLKAGSTPLRERFIEDMKLRKLSECTAKSYLYEVLHCVAHLWKSPERISDEELRGYIRHITEVQRLGGTSLRTAHAGLLFLYERTLGERRPCLSLFRDVKPQNAPRPTLTQEELRKGLARVRDVRYRAALTLAYTCGLRAKEALCVETGDINASRGLLFVRYAKGGKPRWVPLPDYTLKVLRGMWRTHRHHRLLFPAYKGYGSKGRQRHGLLDHPVGYVTLLRCWQKALLESGCRKSTALHSLRHAYATNLLEEGAPLLTVKANMGHSSVTTTCIYAHQTRKLRREGAQAVERLARNLEPRA
jgi:integrase/recombinase XerD